MNPTLKAHLSLFIAQVIYAMNYSIAKDLMPDAIKPLGLVMLRIIGALLLFWTFSFFIKSEKIEKADFKKLMILALFGVAVNQAFFIYGLSITKPQPPSDRCCAVRRPTSDSRPHQTPSLLDLRLQAVRSPACSPSSQAPLPPPQRTSGSA